VTGLPQISTYRGCRLFSLRQECSSQWGRDKAAPLCFSLTADRFALNCKELKVRQDQDSKVTVQAHWAEGHSDSDPKLTLTKMAVEDKANVGAIVDKDGSSSCALPSDTNPVGKWTITTEDRSKLAKLLDIILVVPFECVLDWS
jgi:hypothetical protein